MKTSHKFKHTNFDLKISLESSWDNIWIDYIKNMEFIFSDEKKFNKELKKIWWNIDKNKEWLDILEDTEYKELWQWFYEYEKCNIFYDYNNIVLKINNWYDIKLVDWNLLWKWFLSDISKDDEEFKTYKLWYVLDSNNSDEVFWFWGFIRFEISKWNEKYIFSPFFKTKNLKEDQDVKDMVLEIKKEMLNTLLNHKSISNFWYKIKNVRNNNQQLWEFINIFNEVYKDLEKSVNDIYEVPKYTNTLIHKFRKYNSWKINIDNRLINYSINKWYIKWWKLNIIWKNIPQRSIKWDYNNIPNKVFIELLNNLTKKLDTFINIAKKSHINDDVLIWVINKKNYFKWKRISFINKYELNILKLWNYSLDFQYLDSKYKKFVINYLKLFLLLDLLNWEILIENKTIDQIYEYWTLIKLRDIFYKLMDSNSNKDIFKLKKSKDNLIFEVWNTPVIIEWNNTSCKIIYKFQEKISWIYDKSWNKKIDWVRIISSTCYPDIYIEMHNKETNKDKYLIFDAKYSTDELWNIYKKRFENLYKYKSWIVKCENLRWDEELDMWDGKMNTIIDKVIALYPWNCEEKLAKLYSKSINDIWFWWLVLAIADDNSKVEEFIRVELI